MPGGVRSVSIVATVKDAATEMLLERNRITTAMLVKGLIFSLPWQVLVWQRMPLLRRIL
jgi:hypothetical protein